MPSYNETFFTSDATPGLVFAIGFLQPPRSLAILGVLAIQAAVVLLSCSTHIFCL